MPIEPFCSSRVNSTEISKYLKFDDLRGSTIESVTSKLFDRIKASNFCLSADDNLNSFREGGVARLRPPKVLSQTILSRSTVIFVVSELLSLLRSPVARRTPIWSSSFALAETAQAH